MIDARVDQEALAPKSERVGAGNAALLMALPPKGSCWYCDLPVDSVRRFCSSTCRDDYLEEEAEFGDRK